MSIILTAALILLVLWIILWAGVGISSLLVHLVILVAVVLAVIWLLGLLRGGPRARP